jgi:formate hydrogenlyase transcriptional activator
VKGRVRSAAEKIPKAKHADQRTSEQLRQKIEVLRDSEEQFRDLFDEAPIAYVQEDVDTRLIRANQAAIKILGIEPHEIGETLGKSLVPGSPDAQRRLHRC